MSGMRRPVLRTTGRVGLIFSGEIFATAFWAGVGVSFTGASATMLAFGAKQDVSPMANRNVAVIFTGGKNFSEIP